MNRRRSDASYRLSKPTSYDRQPNSSSPGDQDFESRLLRRCVRLSRVPRTMSANVAASAAGLGLVRDVRRPSSGDPPARDRWFESIFLHRRVGSELVFCRGGSAGLFPQPDRSPLTPLRAPAEELIDRTRSAAATHRIVKRQIIAGEQPCSALCQLVRGVPDPDSLDRHTLLSETSIVETHGCAQLALRRPLARQAAAFRQGGPATTRSNVDTEPLFLLNPIDDNLSDVAACTRAQKGPAQRQCGSFPPALRTGGGRNEARSSRARDSERAVAAHGDGIGAKQGGILKIGNFDSPASMSMLEESTLATNRPMMGVFNNLVMFRHCQPCPAFNLALSFPTAHARRTAGATASIQPRRASR